jgi:hypothetical protein
MYVCRGTHPNLHTHGYAPMLVCGYITVILAISCTRMFPMCLRALLGITALPTREICRWPLGHRFGQCQCDALFRLASGGRPSGGGMITVRSLHRARIYQSELFELILLLKSDKQFPAEKQFPVVHFEARASQSTLPSPPLSPRPLFFGPERRPLQALPDRLRDFLKGPLDARSSWASPFCLFGSLLTGMTCWGSRKSGFRHA